MKHCVSWIFSGWNKSVTHIQLVSETLCQFDFFWVKYECNTHPFGIFVYKESLIWVWNSPRMMKLILLISADIGTQAPWSLTSKICLGPLKITTGESRGLVKILNPIVKIYISSTSQLLICPALIQAIGTIKQQLWQLECGINDWQIQHEEKITKKL